MGDRPEANDEYSGLPVDEDYEQYDKDAWRDFTPFRTGDARTYPSFSEDLRSALGSFVERSVQSDGREQASSHVIRTGDTVRNKHSVGGTLGGAVPPGTKGEVVGVEHDILSDRLVVRFENGYEERVSRENLKYESGWY